MLEEKIQEFITRFEELQKEISSGKILPQNKNYPSIMKEYNELLEIVSLYNKISQLKTQLKELEKMNTTDIQPLVEEEKKKITTEIKKFEKKLKEMIIEKTDPLASKNVILEIRAGTGGKEASLFATDLFRMYSKFIEKNNLKYEILSSTPTDLGGFKEIIISVSGKNPYSILKHESGVHRVQRVPITESSGRIHTSTATVAVLLEPDEIDVKIDEKDLKIETFRSSGPGGQHMQKTESAVRITHIPTGIVVQCQSERSQLKNKEKALKILKAKLYQLKLSQQMKEISDLRKQQIKSAERPQKIRTYNFPQNRVTDHRINLTIYRLKEILDGDLDELVEALNAKIKVK